MYCTARLRWAVQGRSIRPVTNADSLGPWISTGLDGEERRAQRCSGDAADTGTGVLPRSPPSCPPRSRVSSDGG